MKSFKQYLAETESGQVIENSNMRLANDSISPIHGGANFGWSERLQRKPFKKKNETVPDNRGQLRYQQKHRA